MNFQTLTEFLDSLPLLGVPGCDCVIYHKRKLVYRHQAGFSDIEKQIPVNPNGVYNLYSATKPLTCVAVMQLVEKGLILLDDPLYTYIPEYKTMYIEENGERRQAQNAVTIRHLLTMTAGMHYNIRSASIRATVKETGGRVPTLAWARAFANEPLSFEPGTRWQYGLCHDVLGGLVEAVTGKTFGEYCRENIFLPLGMTSTTFLPNEDTERRMMPLYVHNPQDKTTTKVSSRCVFRLGTEFEGGGGGLISSVEDYIQFADMLASGGKSQNGEQILRPETIDLMRTNQLATDVLKTFIWPSMTGYGYGLGVRTMLDRALSGSNGSFREFGWGGAAGAYLLADPERELSAFYAQHMLESLEEYIHPRLRNKIYEGLDA